MAFDADLATHHRRQTFDYRQSQTGAAEAARGGIIDLGKRLKQAMQARLRDADSGIVQVEA